MTTSFPRGKHPKPPTVWQSPASATSASFWTVRPNRCIHAPVYAEDTTLEKLGLDLSRTMRAIAIGLYILSPIPLIGLDMIGMDVLGVCMTLAIVAAATVLLVLFRRKAEEPVDYARR